MGNFSFIAENTGRAIKNPWRQKTLVELQYIKDGKVVEKMRGIYSGYGSVSFDEPFRHEVLEPLTGEWKDVSEDSRSKSIHFDGEKWVTDTWSEIVERWYSAGPDGIAAWELSTLDDLVPLATCQSKDDPGQGDFDPEDDEDEDDYNY